MPERQPSLFGDDAPSPTGLGAYGPRSAPYSNNTTSKAAALAIVPKLAGRRLEVLEAIRKAGVNGSTDEEIEAATGLPGNTVRPRRGELAEMDLIVKARFNRFTRSGNPADVWVAWSVLFPKVAQGT